MKTDVVLIGQAQVGSGEGALGGLILANFLRLLGEREDRPEYIILWNEGVRIAAEGSIWIDHLKRLEEMGTRILSCLTCIEFLGLEGSIAVGKITGMLEIQELLLTKRVLTI